MNFYEILPEDVENPFLKTHLGVIVIADVLGRILPSDIGKRFYKVDGIFQVESNDQRDKRKIVLEKM